MTDQLSKPCVHYSAAEERTCGATPTRLFIQGPRCVLHIPSAERGLPEPPPGTCALARCHCGKPSCPAYETYGRESYSAQSLAWPAVDARAVASGKRRASPQEKAAAKAAVQEQKDRDAAHRRGAQGGA
ncbi:hypothetical protein E1287_07210 [Actinomadura sp. KC06]|uniref:hypothetical protein n=1 Tax=Actinomadura sp. KC06 TaxID=2530369 RepID=UPI00104662C5|nr:hypothetical protein [Actinomadura sp. KC06]TDD37840.1 hypothetical protein E1287_07210 [Actinomadura sp. KC06]